jgi:hypothetical protein
MLLVIQYHQQVVVCVMDMVLVHIQIFVVVPLGTAEPGVICTIVLGKFTILSHTYMNRIAYNSGSVCMSRGACKAPDTCSCNSGYSGISCQSYYCNSTLYTSPSVCNAVGACTASETCSCGSCYTGTYCEFIYCQTGAFALSGSNDAQVFYYDRINTIWVKTAISIPTYLKGRIYCTLNGVQIATQVSGDAFSCTLPVQTGISQSSVGLMYSYTDGTKDISSTKITIWFIQSWGGFRSKVDTYYDFGVVNATNWKIGVYTLSQYQPSSITSQVACYHHTDLKFLPTTALSDTSFECTLNESTPRSIDISLWIVINGNMYSLAYNIITMPIIDKGPISHSASSSNGALVGSQIQSIIYVQSYISSVVALQYGRLLCVVDGVPSAIALYSGSGGVYSCPLSISTPRVHKLDIYVTSPSGSALPNVLLSTNSLPLVIVEQVNMSSVILPQPFTTVNSNFAAIVSQLGFNAAHPGYTIDNYYLFGGNVTYGCMYNGVNMYPAIWYPNNSSLACTLTAPTSAALVSVDVYIITVATGTKLKWNTNSASYLFYSQIPTVALNPYIIPHSILFVSSTMQITLSTALITCNYIYMSYYNGSATTFVPATCDGTSTKLTASIVMNSFSSLNTTVIPIGLAYGYNGFFSNVTSSYVYLTYIRTPIDFIAAPSVFQPGSLTSYSLSFAIPDQQTLLSYNVTYYQDTSSISTNRLTGSILALPCDFTSAGLLSPKCTFTSITPLYVPVKIGFSITFKRQGQAGDSGTTMVMLPHYYKQPINIVKNVPFFTDTMSTLTTPMTFTFTADVTLHPSFTFICQRVATNYASANTMAVILSSRNQFTCSFASQGIDRTETINLLYANVALSSDPGSYPLSLSDLSTNVTASGTSGSIEFNTLSVSPPYMSAVDTSSNFTLMYYNSLTPYVVPALYRSLPLSIRTKETSQLYQCSVDNTSGIVQFKKSLQVVKALGSDVSYDVQNMHFSLYLSSTGDTNSLTATMSSTEVLYFSNNFVTKFPRAVLRGTSSNVTFTFGSSTFSISLNQSYVLFSQSSLGSNVTYSCKAVDTLTLICYIPYSDGQLSYVSLFPYIKVPSFNASEVMLSTNSVNDDVAKLYYIDQGALSLSPPTQLLFLFTQSSTTLQLQFTTTSMPNITAIQSNYVYCLYNFSSISTTVFVKSTFVSYGDLGSGIASFVYNCTNTFVQGTVGITDVSLWYKESDSNTFQISNNSIQVVYTDPINMLSSVPVAGRLNITIATVVQTSFITKADYGDVSFYVRTLYTNSSTDYSYQETEVMDGGYFSCVVGSLITEVVNIDLVMTAMGVNRTISVRPIGFKFVDGNFFTPSYGSLQGNAATYMYNFDGQGDQNITFYNDNSTAFPCVFWQDENTLQKQLNCTTPYIGTKYTPFQSFFTVLGNGQTMSIKYILLDYKNISATASVFPTGMDVNTMISFNSPVTFYTGEGSSVFQMSSSVLTSVIRDDLGILNNTQNISRTFTALPAGYYDLNIMYQNPNLFELRSMVSFTNALQVIFMDPAPISYSSNSNSTGLIGYSVDIYITVAGIQLSSAVKSKMQCRFDSSYVTVISTTDTSGVNTNQLKCTVISSRPVVSTVSLWFVDSSAYNGAFQVSTNTLSMAFMEKLTISTIPWATLNQQQLITLNTSITTDSSLLSPYLTYNCIFYNTDNPTQSNSVSATRVNGTNQFTCTLTYPLSSSQPYARVNVSLQAVSQATAATLSVSSAPTTLYFMKQVKVQSISPFVKSIVASTDIVTISMPLSTLSSSSYSDEVATSYQLYCKYTTVDQQRWLYSPAHLITSSDVGCDISVTHAQQIELVDVRLWYNGGGLPLSTAISNGDGLSFDLVDSQNNVTIMFIQQPLAFTDPNQVSFNGMILRPNVLDQKLSLNFSVPSSLVLPISYQINMNAIEGQSSSALSNCDYTKGSIVKCVVVSSSLVVPRVPILFNFTLSFTNTDSQEVVTWPVTSLTYYETTNIQRAYPYALSYTETVVDAAEVQFTVDTTVNTLYNYQCLIMSQSGKNYTVPATLQSDNNYTCDITSFNALETVHVQLQVLQPMTLYSYPLIVPISANNASISFISPIRMNLAMAPIPQVGSFMVKTIDALPVPPTQYHNNSDYGIRMEINDRGMRTALQSCSVDSSSYIQCNLPSSLAFYSYPWYVKMDLYMMAGAARSSSLAPKFLFFKAPTFSYLSTPIVLRVTAPVSTSYLTVYGSNFFVTATNPIIITYSCTTGYSVTTGTSTQVETCKLSSSTQLLCPLPQFNYFAANTSGDIQMTVSMAGTSFDTDLKLSLYELSSMAITSVNNRTCNPFTTQTVQVNGHNFVKGSIWVYYTDYASYTVTTQTGVQYVSANTITIQSPVLWNMDYMYPRSVYFSLSFDNGANYITNTTATLTYTNPIVTFYPFAFMVGQTITNMQFSNFPLVTTGANRKLVVALYDSYTAKNITLNCNSGFTCSSVSALPSSSIIMSLRAYSVSLLDPTDIKRVYIPFYSAVTVYKYAVATSVFPSRLFPSMTDKIVITGDFSGLTSSFSVSMNQNSNTKTLTVVSLTNNMMILSGVTSMALQSVSSRRAQTADMSIVVTPAGTGTTETLLSTNAADNTPVLSVLSTYSVSYALNNDFQNELDTIFTFQPTNITIYGSGFPLLNASEITDSVRIKFSHALF